MPIGERKFTQIPPRNTGDRILLKGYIDVFYKNATGTFAVNDFISTVTSAISGVIVKVQPETGTAGLISILVDDDDIEKDFVDSEGLVVDMVTIAEVDGAPVTTGNSITLYSNVQNLGGGNNPYNLQHVDRLGNAHVRFNDGNPELDAFGRLRVSQSTALGEYQFALDNLPSDFQTTTSGGATETYETNTAAVVFTTGTGASESVTKISNKYHAYTPGFSQNITMTVACSDAGKANVIRRWGYFDANDGVFFELNGTSMRLVIRSSTSGSPVETIIEQADWNTDTFDGDGDADNISQVQLDVSKDVQYWMDLQWLGSGRVRFGINVNGERLTGHEFNSSNILSLPYMRSGSLPIKWEQISTSAASTSEMRAWAAAVFTENNNFDPKGIGFTAATENVVTADSTTAPNRTYAMSIRSKSTFLGRTNHTVAITNFIDIIAINDNTGDPGRIRLEIFSMPSLTGSPSWTSSSLSAYEYDVDATGYTGGTSSGVFYVNGHERIDLSGIVNYLNGAAFPFADGSSILNAFVVTNLDVGTTCSVHVSVSWREVRI